MKLHNLFLAFLLSFTGILYGQAPQGISYQAVARDNAGIPLLNRAIQMRFTVSGNGGADIFYQETHALNSDALGGIHLVIGSGIPTTGNFSLIDWKSGDVRIQVEMDPNGGQNFIPYGLTVLQSVPYALYAHQAGSLDDNASIDPGQIGGGGASVGDVLIWNGSEWGPGEDLDQQTLSVNGNQLAISNGNSVTLPTGSGGGDHWGDQFVETDQTLTGDGTLTAPLGLAQQGAIVGEVLKWNGSDWVADADNGQEYVEGTGIDITGNTISNTGDNDNDADNEIQTLSINGQVLSLTNGGSVNLPSTTYTEGTGIDIAGNTISALNEQNLWNANKIQNFNVSTDIPVGGNILKFNPDGNQWFPGIDSEGDDPWNEIGSEVHYMGNVGIGVINPSSRLHVIGGSIQLEDESVSKYGANSFEFTGHIIPAVDDNRSLGLSTRRFTAVWATDGTINTSDVREKTNISNLNYGLAELMKLRPVSYTWISRPESGTKIGLIAQELETIIPEVVANSQRTPSLNPEEEITDRLGVYYSDLIPVLIKAIQEQEGKIQQLQAEIDLLKKN